MENDSKELINPIQEIIFPYLLDHAILSQKKKKKEIQE